MKCCYSVAAGAIDATTTTTTNNNNNNNNTQTLC
jgi:hypothetical protein